MFDTMQLLDEQTGLPKFKEDYRDSDGKTYRIHAYVTYNKACPCSCSFCKNKQFSNDIKSSNIGNMRTTLKKFSSYIHSITFGGGEPLIFIDDLLTTMQEVYFDSSGYQLSYNPKKYMITSGLQEQFLQNKKRIFSYFDRIYLTRQRKSDEDNQRAFNTQVPILTTSDLWSLGYDTVSKIEVVSTCYKNGGIDTAKEMIELIEWTAYIGSEYIIFNDLQYDVTNEKYYQEHQISDDVFETVIEYLKGQGFEQKIEVCFSGGYTIRMFDGLLKIGNKNRLGNDRGWYIRVGFKRYHKSGTTLDIWKNAKKRTFDLSIMPNGELFTDWANKQSSKNI